MSYGQIRRQCEVSPASPDGQHIAGMVSTYCHCHHRIPTHHNPLSQHYCLKDGCVKYKVSKLRHLGSDFLKSCNFPGTRPECVATSLSPADDDDRLQPSLMSSELGDCPGSNNEECALSAGDQ